MGGGTDRNRAVGKESDRGDPPDDRTFLIDLFASEYGWTIAQIDALPIDEEARLFHALLYRKGVKCYRKIITTDYFEKSLSERIADKQSEIDTSDLEEGITWHLP